MERPKIVDELESVMSEKNVSLETAARLIPCSKSSIFRWLKGESVPSKLYVRAIRRAIRRMEEVKGVNQD